MAFDSKQYYQDNKEQLLKYGKQYRENNKKYFDEYQKDNKEKLTAYAREYNRINKVRLKEYYKEYKIKNKQAVNKYHNDCYNRKFKALKVLFGNHCAVNDDTCKGRLELHHKNPAVKRFGLSGGVVVNLTPKWLYEISRCDLLCQKHHQDAQAKVRNYRKRKYII